MLSIDYRSSDYNKIIKHINKHKNCGLFVMDGSIIKQDGCELVKVNPKLHGAYTVPAEVKILGRHVFDSDLNISTVVIPNTVIDADNYIFSFKNDLLKTVIVRDKEYILKTCLAEPFNVFLLALNDEECTKGCLRFYKKYTVNFLLQGYNFPMTAVFCKNGKEFSFRKGIYYSWVSGVGKNDDAAIQSMIKRNNFNAKKVIALNKCNKCSEITNCEVYKSAKIR